MANGIFNILTDKIFPATAPGSQTESSKLKESLFASPITNSEADAALNHITGKFVERQTAASQTAAVKNSDDETQKTIVDFYKEILAQQPFNAETLAKKKLSVVLEAGKPAAEMTLADYEMAKNRAIFKQAGYSMLTDEEIQMAVSGIKSNGSVNNNNFGLDNLRRIDSKPGAMFITTDKATIEYAKRAGQAVLQYQEYKAKQADANQEKARSETNQMLLDPLRLGGNVPFRWTERLLNTPRDILQKIDNGDIIAGSSTAKWLGGKISEQITGQPAPQIPTASESVEKLTGAKLPAIPEIKLPRPFEYQTEKYKREGNIGEDLGATAIDLFLLKRGIIGKSEASPQSLKTLGGLPETATTAATATNNAAKAEQTAKWVDKAGKTIYPPNNGFAGTPKKVVLKPGTFIDRFGFEGGNFVSPKGVPYANRALPPGSATKPYHIYEIVKPVKGLGGKAASWFGEPGGGTQFMFEKTIQELKDEGYIIERFLK